MSQYHCYYIDLPFSNIKVFLQNLRRAFPQVRIPYIDLLHLHQDIIECLDRYIYIPIDADIRPIIAKLNRQFGSSNVTYLSVIRQAELDRLQERSLQEGSPTIKPGDFYQLISGPWVNLIVQVDSIFDQQVLCKFHVLDQVRTITVNMSELKALPSYIPSKQSFSNLLDLQRHMSRKAIVLDGHNVLFRCFHGYNNVYRAPTVANPQRRFVGAAHGFFYKLLQFRELYPEYELHTIFDGFDQVKFAANPSYKADRPKMSKTASTAMDDNLDWIKRFIQAAGLHLYYLPEAEGDDVVGSLAKYMENDGYSDIIIHSADTDFYQCLSPNVSLLQPKKSYRDAPHLVKVEEGLAFFGINNIGKVNWLRALTGDSTDNIMSIHKFNKQHKLSLALNRKDMLEAVNNAKSVADVVSALSPIPQYHRFMKDQYHTNLELLSLKLDLLNEVGSLETFRSPNNFPNSEYAPTYDADAVFKLLEEVGLYSELEMFSRTSRILCGLW